MKSLNLSKFKKISSDGKTTTLAHPDGHTIKVAHAVLSPELKKGLESLPIHKAGGGMIKKYAEGGETNSNADQPMRVPAQLNSIEDVKNMLLGKSISEQPQAQQPPPQAQPAPAPSAPLNIEEAPAAMQPQPNNQQQGLSAQQQKTSPAIEDDEPNSGGVSIDGEQPTQDQAPAQQNQDQPQKEYQKSYNDYVQEHTKEHAEQDAAFAQDLHNGHITPETYHDLFAKKSTLGKIGMIFGMMSSGAGSGLSHQPNAMLQMMNNEIQNDLEAQKQSKGNAQSFIKLNQQQQMVEAQSKLMGSQSDLASAEANVKATALANMQMNRAALDKISKQVQSLPVGSPERIKQEQTLAMMYQAVNNENFNIGSRAASAAAYFNMLMGQPGNAASGGEQAFQQKTNGMRMLGSQGQEMAKNLEDKHFPGIKGQASVPLTSEDRSSINSGIDFDQKLHRFIDWTQNHSGDLNPSDRKYGTALAAELQGAYRQATHGGVYKEGEQNFISKLIDQEPTKFFNSIRVTPSLKAIAGENQAKVNQLVKSKGFGGYESPYAKQNQSSGSGPVEGTTGTHKGKPVVFKSGKWTYQ